MYQYGPRTQVFTMEPLPMPITIVEMDEDISFEVYGDAAKIAGWLNGEDYFVELEVADRTEGEPETVWINTDKVIGFHNKVVNEGTSS